MDLSEEENNYSQNSEVEYDVEKILDYRVKLKYTRGRKPKNKERKKKYITEYLVKWLGNENPSWEPEENLDKCKILLNKFLERKKKEENNNNIKNPKDNLHKKEKTKRIKHKKNKLKKSTNNKIQSNKPNDFLFNNNSFKDEKLDSFGLIDKKEVYNFFDNYNEEWMNSGSDFGSINNQNLYSFKDGLLSNKKINDEKENLQNSKENIIHLSSKSYNNTNKFLDEDNFNLYSISEFNY